MSELIVVGGLLTAFGVASFFIARRFLLEGLRDEVEVPLANCDTSMVEECMSDVPVKKADNVSLSVLELEEDVKH